MKIASNVNGIGARLPVLLKRLERSRRDPDDTYSRYIEAGVGGGPGGRRQRHVEDPPAIY